MSQQQEPHNDTRQQRWWMFTQYPFADDEVHTKEEAIEAAVAFHGEMKEWPLKCARFNVERCPTTMRWHFQGVACFKQVKRLTALKKVHPTAHWGDHKGRPCWTPRNAWHYCGKPCDGRECLESAANPYCTEARGRGDEPMVYAIGEYSGQGERNDIKALTTMIREGKSDAEINELYPDVVFKNLKQMDAYRARFFPPTPMTKDPKIILLYGNPGTGKSTYVRDVLAVGVPVYEPTEKNADGGAIWFDHYDGRQPLLFDDFSGPQPDARGASADLGFGTFKRLFSRGVVKLQCKHGTVQARPPAIYITCNPSHHPKTWWPKNQGDDDVEAFIRRLYKIYVFTGYRVFDVLKTRDEKMQFYTHPPRLPDYVPREPSVEFSDSSVDDAEPIGDD